MTRTDHGRLTLRAIEIFVAVVEAGSFAIGAQRLGASTSSVSQQITNLEAALGAKLIDRSARPLALTPAGYVFQRRALAILDEASRAQSELAELELTNLPQLRLAVIEDFDADVTPELAVRLSRSLPGCNIVAHAGPSHENLAALESREVDLVVATDIDTAPEWMEQHPLLRDPYEPNPKRVEWFQQVVILSGLDTERRSRWPGPKPLAASMRGAADDMQVT